MKSENSVRLLVQTTRIGRRKIIFCLAYIAYLVLFALWSVYAWDGYGEAFQERIFPWVLSSLVINIVSLLWVDKRKYYDVCVWFVLLSYAFMFGHVFTSVLDMQTTLIWDPSTIYSNNVKLHASIFAVAALCSFSFGCMIVGNRKQYDSRSVFEKDDRLFYIGTICTVVGFICNAYSSLAVIKATQLAGTYASYTDASTNGLISAIGFLFVPGVIYLLFSNKLSTASKSLLCGSATAYFLIVMMLSGSRKTGIFAIVALGLAFLSNRKARMNITTIVVVSLFGLMFLDLVYVIRETRFDLSMVFPTFLESLQTLEFLNELIGESLTEMGLTFYSVAGIIQAVPTIFPYELGMTILQSVCSILPIGWAVGDFFDAGSSTYVINRYLGSPVGASLIGDFYWNWGFAGGCIACFIFGVALAFVFKKLASSATLLPLYYSISYITLIGVRAGIFELTRPLFVVVAVPILVSHFYVHYRLRKSNEKSFNSRCN